MAIEILIGNMLGNEKTRQVSQLADATYAHTLAWTMVHGKLEPYGPRTLYS